MLNKIFAVAAATAFATTAFAQAPSAGPAAGPAAAPAVTIKPAAAALEKKVEAPKVDAAKTVDSAKTKATHAHKHAADAAKQAADLKPSDTIPTK